MGLILVDPTVASIGELERSKDEKKNERGYRKKGEK